VAGIGGMEYRTFARYNVVGGLLWTLLLTLSGFYLGTLFPNIKNYLEILIIGITLVSLLPIFFEWIKQRRV
jgi:membrane-associated protein